MRTGVPVLRKLERVAWADGRTTWSIINKIPLQNEHGETIGTFGLTTDGLVLATGYAATVPAFLDGVRDRIRFDERDVTSLAPERSITRGISFCIRKASS